LMNHLTDNELIDHIIKFSNDPEKIRLATVMERVTGAIIDDLIDAGMDETYCTFRSEWGGTYHPGQYIKLLEDEITDRDFQIKQLHDELEEQKSRTIADLIEELNQEIKTKQYLVEEARAESRKAYEEAKDAKEKLKMWNHLRSV
jgi:CDP-glycerol glycerophosphotransferase (TagB/SpsB family)